MNARLALLPALLAALSACSNPNGIPAGLEPNPLNNTGTIQAVGLEETPSFLPLMIDAPFTVAYRGVRRIELHYNVTGAPEVVEYRERVGANGNGEWEINTLEVLTEGQMAPDLFMMLMDSRQNFTYQYRDFRIRNLAYFEATFKAQVTDVQVEFAGQHLTQMRIQRIVNPRTYYSILVDPATGLVLRWEERLMEGQLVALMEFEEIEFTAPADDSDLQGPEYVIEPVDLHGSTVDVGFSHLVPQLIPIGYRLHSADKLLIEGADDWVKQVYTDGVESLIFLYAGPDASNNGSGVVEHLKAGPWTVVTGSLLTRPVILAGKVPVEQLFDMLQSSIY